MGNKELYLDRCEIFGVQPQEVHEDFGEVVQDMCYEIMAQGPTATYRIVGNSVMFKIEMNLNCDWSARIDSDFGRDQHKEVERIVKQRGFTLIAEEDIPDGIRYSIIKNNISSEEVSMCAVEFLHKL